MSSGPEQRRSVGMPGVPQHTRAGADSTRPSHPGGHSSGEYARARVTQDDHAQWERVQAAQTVACNALSIQDLRLLLSILGLEAADRHVLS